MDYVGCGSQVRSDGWLHHCGSVWEIIGDQMGKPDLNWPALAAS